MDKVLRPERLDVDPVSSNAAQKFNYEIKTFRHYIAA